MMRNKKKSTLAILSVPLKPNFARFIVFHKEIAFKDFLFKINRTDSPDCSFCQKKPEAIVHIFSECGLANPLWQEINTIFDLQNDNIVSVNFSKIFGIQGN